MNEKDIAKKGMSGDLIKGASQIGLVKIASTFIGLASTIVLARLLLPEDFGLIAIAMAVMMMVSTLSEMSLGAALVQLDEIEDDHYHTAFTLGVLRSIIITVIIIALSGPIAGFYEDERLRNIFLAFSGAAFIGGFENPKMNLFIRRLQFRPSLIVTLSEKCGSFAIAAITAYIFRSYWALVYSFIGAQLIRIILGYVLIRYRPKLSLSRSSDILGFSVWITLGNWVQTLNWRSDPLVLGYFVPMSALGQFGMAERVTRMATRDVIAPVAQVLFPAFSRIKSDPERLRPAYLKALSTLASIAFPAAIGLAVLAEPITLFVLGAKWEPIIPFLQLMCLISLFKAMQHVQPLAMATGHTRALLGRDIRALLIRAPLLFGGIYLGHQLGWGILIGAIAGRGAASFINMIWNMQLIKQITTISLTDHLRAFWRPLVATGIMGVTVYSASVAPMFQSLHVALQLLIWVSLGGLVYVATLWISWRACKRPDGPEQTAFDLYAKLKTRMFAR